MRVLHVGLLTLMGFLFFVGCVNKNPNLSQDEMMASTSDSILEMLETSLSNKNTFDCNYPCKNIPDNEPIIFAPGKISTGKENGAISFSPDGKEIWFARIFPHQIFYMEYKKGKWSNPKPAPFSGKYKDLYPCLSPDGKKLFFSSNRPLNENDGKNSRVLIWESRRMQAGWTQPRNIGSVVNFGSYHICPTISARGSLFYNLITKMKGEGYLDIFESKYIYNTFSKPQRLSISVNSASLDYGAFIAKDESYIIFASNRHSSGDSDLFICYKNKTGDWTKAINLGPTINSESTDDFPTVSPDGKFLFFNSSRKAAGNGLKKSRNIYWVSAGIIEKLKPDYLKKTL